MVAFFAPVSSQANVTALSEVHTVNAPLILTQGKAKMVTLPSNVSDILVADPDLVDVVAVQPNKIYVVGLMAGDTNIIALNEKGETIRRIDMHVTIDTQALQSELNRLFPDEDITVSAIHGRLILQGSTSNPATANKIENVVSYYLSSVFGGDAANLSEHATILLGVQGEQQVMLKVRLVEASRAILKELGVETNANDTNLGADASDLVFGQFPPKSTSGGGDSFTGQSGNPLAAASAMWAGSLIADSGIDAIGLMNIYLQALEKENLVNILAEPNLTAISGEEAGFLAGGQFPVPTGRDNDGNVTIEFKEFGASLAFKPVVLSEDRISLQMEVEVSSLDNENSVVLQGVEVPGLKIRRASTTVEVPSGSTLMIAGILASSTVKDLSGLPGIKDTPILGDLVSSDSFNRSDTELVVMVTPYLVKPFADKDATVEKKHKPKKKQPLDQAFLINMQRVYGFNAINKLTEEGSDYGYILE